MCELKSIKSKLLLVFVFFGQFSFSQQIINPSSGFDSTSRGKVSFCIGNVFYATSSNSTRNSIEVVDKNNLKKIFRVYPNPTSDILNIESTTDYYASFKIELFDVFGKQLTSKISNNFLEILIIEFLPTGSYLLKITNNHNSSTEFFNVIKK
jgi:hypothetical protein